MKYEVSKINPWSLARMTSLITVALTIVISVPYFGIMLLFSGGFGYIDSGSSWMVFGIAGILGFILMSYVMGIISGFVIAFIYNWIAEHQRGIEIEIDLVEEQK
ncbi:MAG: hypothetical protein WCT33_04995 [Patescibacteria group bacterium]|jgi:hypothetical protein